MQNNSSGVMSVFNQGSKKRIKQRLAESIERDINDIIYWKFTFRKIGDYAESFSQLTTLCATVVAFAGGYSDSKLLSFLAGCLGSISLALLKASAAFFS